MKFFASATATLTAMMALAIGMPVLAQHDADEVDMDAPGAEESLNAQIWEYMKKTPYSAAKLYLSSHKKSAGADTTSDTLPTGWKLSPAGRQSEVGRLPSEATQFGSDIVVLNAGYYSNGPEDPEVTVLSADGSVKKTIRIPSLFPSAVVSPDGDLYISGGIGRKVYRLNSSYEIVRSYDIDGFASGIAVIDGTHIAVASLVNADSDNDFKKGAFVGGRLTIVNTKTGLREHEIQLGNFPYAVACTSGKLFVTMLGDDAVAQIDVATAAVTHVYAVGKRPQNLALDTRSGRLYVVNTGCDSLSVIDTKQNLLLRDISLKQGKSDFGSAPVSCAVDPSGNRLFVALANTNAIAVLDSASGKQLGKIPTGWYPTRALLTPEHLVVLNGKGVRARRPNPDGPQPAVGKGGPAYVLTLLRGTAEFIPLKEIGSNLAAFTRTADISSPQTLSGNLRIKKQIKHIFYIVRENRTYDQVMGDLSRADGDPSLNLFGRSVTPNGHSIADQFVTLDNYFADGEISVLGHSFTTSGYASPFLEWLGNAAYSGRYNGYPFGMVPSVTSPAYLWDALDAKNKSYKVYGENYYLYTRAYDILNAVYGPGAGPTRKFYARMMKLASQTDRGGIFYEFASVYAGRADTIESALTLLGDSKFVSEMSHFLFGDDTLAALLPLNDDLKRRFGEYLTHYQFNYRSWDLKTSDLDRIKVWKSDFDRMVKVGAVPAFEYLWLPNDHTGGVSKLYLPPDQLVSQNDAALGYLLETISHSPIWKDSLILVTEDDAQNGPDHVDATRTVALAAGPSVRRGAVVHDRYDQLSLLRTIDLLLGLRPLNEIESLAVPMVSIFADKPDKAPFASLMPSGLAAEDAAKAAGLHIGGLKQ